MHLKVKPTTKLLGEITAPGSKSYSHRAFIAAGFADGVSIIKNALVAGDVEVTIDALRSLGVNIHKEADESFVVKKSENFLKPVEKVIDCKNSGTTIRILSALSLLVEGGLSLGGIFLERKRPIVPLLDALTSLGAKYNLSDDRLTIHREKKGCDQVKIRGDISSQFITALLFISSLIECKRTNFIEIQITKPLVSYPFIQITLEILKSFGVTLREKIKKDKTGKYSVTCAQNYRPQLYEIPGDFSSAAFIMAGACLSPDDSDVTIRNLYLSNSQGDKRIVELLKKMGANIKVYPQIGRIKIRSNINKNPLHGIEIDCSDIPDLFPILSVVGAFAQGKTVLFNASNLRAKESDRIAVMNRELNKMGVKTEEEEDKLTIYHCDEFQATEIDHENDHRIAMACSIAALYGKSVTTISNIDIIRDSYPNFITDLKTLGAKLEIDL